MTNPEWMFVGTDGEVVAAESKVSGLGLAYAWANELPWLALERVMVLLPTAADYGAACMVGLWPGAPAQPGVAGIRSCARSQSYNFLGIAPRHSVPIIADCLGWPAGWRWEFFRSINTGDASVCHRCSPGQSTSLK